MPNLTPKTNHYYLKAKGANPTPKEKEILKERIAGLRLTLNGITRGSNLQLIMSNTGHSPLKARAVVTVDPLKELTPRHYGATFIRSLDIPLTGATTIPIVLEDHLPPTMARGVNHAIDLDTLQIPVTPLLSESSLRVKENHRLAMVRGNPETVVGKAKTFRLDTSPNKLLQLFTRNRPLLQLLSGGMTMR
jgi:hypothetical protein